jgi:hypothetical protein
MVKASPGVRIAVGRQRPLLDCRDCPRVDLGNNSPYAVYTQDEQAARRTFADAAFRVPVDRLMGGRGSPVLYVQPDQFWFRVRATHVAEEGTEGWLQDLLRLAAVSPHA